MTTELKALKLDIQLKAKNGIDFMTSATITWLLIAVVWTMDFSAADKSVITFMVGTIMLPMAFGLSKIYKTVWKIKNNPLQPLGLWLNFAQLIYFPFLIFMLSKYPDYFIMAYAIITGAHLFPYAWFYDEIGYAIGAVLISFGSMFMAFYLPRGAMFYIPLFASFCFLCLVIWIYIRVSNRNK